MRTEYTHAQLQARVDYSDCRASVRILASAIRMVETAASAAFLADDMKVATSLRTIAKNMRLQLDPLTQRWRMLYAQAAADGYVGTDDPDPNEAPAHTTEFCAACHPGASMLMFGNVPVRDLRLRCLLQP